ncbi:MAG TPA: ferredoxin family protein [Chloroflexota bacterium]|nr:ferredoxin family protein [Chloroflexota bacterium]
MAYVIIEACIGTMDRSCVDVCPVDCIHFEEGVDRMLFINPEECIDCGACEPACPVTAIYPEDAVPDDMEVWKAINAQWFQDADAARAEVDRRKPPE